MCLIRLHEIYFKYIYLIDKWLVPAGCEVLLPLFAISRDPKHWEHPEDFYPDHHLPEAVKKRHSYSFLPFSAGPRGCIGKLLLLSDFYMAVFTTSMFFFYNSRIKNSD